MRMVDMVCPGCETRRVDVMCDTEHTERCPNCGMLMQQDWLPRVKRPRAQWDDSTAVHVFINERTGEPRYPGRTDAVCPTGYRREVLRSLRDVERFEKAHGVRNEAMWYDRNGRGFDDTHHGRSI